MTVDCLERLKWHIVGNYVVGDILVCNVYSVSATCNVEGTGVRERLDLLVDPVSDTPPSDHHAVLKLPSVSQS